jgi:hypothetical protein
MNTRRTLEPVHVVRVRQFCLEDNIELRATGIALLSSPLKYPHRCPICKKEVNFSKTYPSIEYRE